MEKCTESFDFRVNKPKEFKIRTNRFEDWERTIKDNLNNTV